MPTTHTHHTYTQIIPQGFGSVTHRLSLTNDVEQMNLTYGVSLETFPLTNAQTTVDALRNAFVTAFGGIIATGYQHVETELVIGQETQADFPKVLNTTGATFTGTVNPLPQNCALLVHKRTGITGRRNRGRLYFPGINEGEVGPTGLLTPALITLYQTPCNSWLAAIAAASEVGGMFLLHGLRDDQEVVPPPTAVTVLTVDGRIATQRRRLRP